MYKQQLWARIAICDLVQLSRERRCRASYGLANWNYMIKNNYKQYYELSINMFKLKTY